MRYKQVLEKYGVTQLELAEKLGINRVSVSRLLSDKNDMRMSTAEKIAKAIGCSPIEFFDDYEEPKASEPCVTCPKCGHQFPVTISTKL